MLLELTFVFAIGSHGADLASTEYCLGRGVCHEMNPWLARFNQPAVFGLAKMSVAAASEWGVYKLSKEHPTIAALTNLAIGGTFLAIAAHNARVTGRAHVP